MSQEQLGMKRISGIGFVAAFGLMTMSSSISSQSITTMNSIPNYHHEAYNYSLNDGTVCNSSMLSRQAVGDIVSMEKRFDFVQCHEKIKVNFEITKITKHISNFDFEEEYEEI